MTRPEVQAVAVEAARAARLAERQRLAAILSRRGAQCRRRGRADLADLLADLARSVVECDDAGEPPLVWRCPQCGEHAPRDGRRCDVCGCLLAEAPMEDL